MTFNQIALKMFKSNFKRYLLFFLCSTFTITIFFMYATLFTNKQFMDSNKMYYSIASNTIAPSFIIGIFSVFFIIYAQSSFNKFRKHEFGLLMVLGCTNGDIRKIILLENSLIALFSLIAGLGTGSICSKIFYLIIIRITGISEVSFTLNFTSYFYTILLFTAIYAIVITVAMISTLRLEVLDLIKELKRGDKGVVINPIFFILGIMIIVFAIIDMLVNFNVKNSSVILRSLIICFIGTYLVMSNFVWINKKISSLSKKSHYRNMLFISNMNNTFGKTRKLLLISTWLIGCSIFLGSLGMIMYTNSQESAIKNNPYDVAYSQQYRYNNIPNAEVNDIVNKGQTPLIEYKELGYIEQNSFLIFSENEIKRLSKCNFNIKPGQFINLYQFNKDDGYNYQTKDVKNIEIRLNNKSMNLVTQGNYIKVIFNPDAVIFSYKILVINHEDYLQIAQSVDKTQFGMVKLFNFKDWKKTQGIVDRFNLVLKKYNKGNERQLEVASKITSYKNNIAGSSFLLFLLFFVGAIFFLAANIMLHFKLLMEFEREKLKYKQIYRIGITSSEVKMVVYKELRTLFFLPVIAGLVISTFYIYASLNATMGLGFKVIEASLSLGFIYICLQILMYIFYKGYYVKKLFNR